MKKYKKLLTAAFFATIMSCLFAVPAFAISEGEVQSQVAAAGKEAVAGNVLIWFLCAVAFLKVSQKIDSFMSSLGINVGHTGGSLLAETMIAMRGINAARGFASGGFSGHGGGASSGSSGHGPGGGSGAGAAAAAGFMSGGLAGVVSRQVTNSAIRSATTHTQSATGGGAAFGGIPGGSLGSRIYSSSVNKGGDFANTVISSIAHGSIATEGSITGDQAAEALSSYMGFAALEPGAESVPSFSGVEIGGGRITGTETTAEHPEGVSFGMYHTEQYAQPQGEYTTVHAVDGSAWYKQYAAPAVDKSPYMGADGKVGYNESIVQRLPQPPHRKDRL